MRLFVAIDISEETRAQLRHVREALLTRFNASRHPPRVTWVADEAAHVTVRFIGEVPETVGDGVQAALGSALPVAPYSMEFRGIGGFPNQRRPRVVWIGAPVGQEQTARVASLVNARLDAIVGKAEERPFRAHLTLARVKEAHPFDWDAAFRSIDAGRTVSQIDHVTLYQSRTSPKGPTYTAISTTSLQAGTDK